MDNRAPGFIKNPKRDIHFEPSPCRIRVKYAGQWIADTYQALIMYESGHLPVYYFPFTDIKMDLLQPTTHSTYCQYKGEASYWSIRVSSSEESENAVWAYQEPYDEMIKINLQNYCAFYWEKVDNWYEGESEVKAIQAPPR